MSITCRNNQTGKVTDNCDPERNYLLVILVYETAIRNNVSLSSSTDENREGRFYSSDRKYNIFRVRYSFFFI